MSRLRPTAGVLHALFRQIGNRYWGRTERFEGSARDICSQILERLWYGDFYRTSLGHFNFFWMRDFGTVADDLVQLGHETRVHYTLRWTLRRYQIHGRITTCIDSFGTCFNAPGRESIDALPWLLHSLVVSRYVLNTQEKAFLSRELQRFTATFLDVSGDIRADVLFAEQRDAVYYDRSAYAVGLVGRLAACVEQLHLPGFGFRKDVYEKILTEHYWNGNYLNADRTNDAFSADSALVPLFLDVLSDTKKVDATLDYIEKKKINRPYPVRYGFHDKEFRHRLGMGRWIMPEYTGNTIWTWHGTFYLHLLARRKNPLYAQNYRRFSALIERHKTYPELVVPDGSWYKAIFYRADPGMVWVALFLTLPSPKK